MNARRALSVLLFLSAPGLAGDDYSAIFDRAIESIDFEFEHSWAYTETQVTGEAVWVGRYDPRLDEGARWQLLTIDGREPTEEEHEIVRNSDFEYVGETGSGPTSE